ncbi:hypothetical protein SASPL_140276 [Salvia splendens]|uniref:WAT1-related protein n=1 Tax=Salvia splendens TaxID=180675 RepID=A0A8X8WNK3_SALSN|nr:hypothetical protein SASPL_140276 [Salvia splendens]
MKAAMVEAAPCAAMVLVEGSIIGLTIMASTAMARGMSPFVFVVYTNILGSILLLPYCFFYQRERSEDAVFTLKFMVRVFLLGLIGITIAQNLAFVGLSYSSPIVACGMANQIPAFSFILGIILRTIKFDWKRSGSQARVIGTLISFAGAISVTLYRGPTIRSHSSPSLSAAPPRLFVFLAPHENWVLGCVLFAASSFTLAIWNILQVGTVKMCSNVMKIISFYSLFGTMQSAVVALFFEKNPSAWRLDLNFELLVIVLTFDTYKSIDMVHEMEGPLFCARIQTIWNSVCKYLRFMMGAFVCGMGYYTVLWGEIKEGEAQRLDDRRNDSSTAEKVPLLQDKDSGQV